MNFFHVDYESLLKVYSKFYVPVPPFDNILRREQHRAGVRRPSHARPPTAPPPQPLPGRVRRRRHLLGLPHLLRQVSTYSVMW